MNDKDKNQVNELLDQIGISSPEAKIRFIKAVSDMWKAPIIPLGSIEDLSLILSEEQLGKLGGIFESGALQILQSNKQILFDPSVKNGVQIISNSEGFKVSFSDEDLENFFRKFMKPRIQEYLFTSSENE